MLPKSPLDLSDAEFRRMSIQQRREYTDSVIADLQRKMLGSKRQSIRSNKLLSKKP